MLTWGRPPSVMQSLATLPFGCFSDPHLNQVRSTPPTLVYPVTSVPPPGTTAESLLSFIPPQALLPTLTCLAHDNEQIRNLVTQHLSFKWIRHCLATGSAAGLAAGSAGSAAAGSDAKTSSTVPASSSSNDADLASAGTTLNQSTGSSGGPSGDPRVASSLSQPSHQEEVAHPAAAAEAAVKGGPSRGEIISHQPQTTNHHQPTSRQPTNDRRRRIPTLLNRVDGLLMYSGGGGGGGSLMAQPGVTLVPASSLD